MSSRVRIAHLSDVHVLERNPRASLTYAARLRFLTNGRPLDIAGRAAKLRRAFEAAKAAAATHFIVSGDLTEIGSDAQFEAFAEILSDTKITPERITLLPGNHDAYTSPQGWTRALAGPLRPYAATSAEGAGKVVDLGGVGLLPVDATCHQTIARSGGILTLDAVRSIGARLTDPTLAKKALAIVLHHPPTSHEGRTWQWIDGLRGAANLIEVLKRHAQLHLLHGHAHSIVDRVIGACRVFGAPAVVDDGDAPRVRLYDLDGGALVAAP